MNHEEIFTDIYFNCKWGNNGNKYYQGSSGFDSKLEYNIIYIRFLKQFIKSKEISTVVDLGCGDFIIGNELYNDLNIKYTGYDVYSKIINYHQSEYSSNSSNDKYKFFHLDFYNNPKEIIPADLYIIKDVLTYWTNEEIYKCMDYLVNTKRCKYILLINDYSKVSNESGSFFFRNLNYDTIPLSKYSPSKLYEYNHKQILFITPGDIIGSINNINSTTKINYCSFYTEGPPHDTGMSLEDCKEYMHNTASRIFNKVTFYTPTILHSLGYSKYLREYADSPIIPYKSILKLGLSSFRAAMFLHELSKMNDGDILIHRDINYKKYPNLANFDNIKENALKALDICGFDFFVPAHSKEWLIHEGPRKNKILTKTNVLRELGEDHPFSYEFPSVHAYMFVMRKSPITIQLLTEWQTAMEREEWMDGLQYGPMDPSFKFTCIDQSILSVIIANWIRKRTHNISLKYPFIGFPDRDLNKIQYYSNYASIDYLKLLN